MDTSIITRFQQIIDTFAESNRSEFARITGKKPSHITDICKGRTSFTMQYLITLATLFHINLHWLLLGEGRMKEETSLDDANEFIHVPLYDVQASAGYGSVIHSEQIVDHLAFKRQWITHDLATNVTQLALITITGDSMYPTLSDGDLVLVDLSQSDVNRDGIYLLQFDGGLMAKRIQKDYEQNLHVISDNKLYKEFVINPEQKNHAEIVGKVVWFGRKV
ncbi:helix-turn-helix transcriptional regulator [Deltaproteobacteria bacterium TL4]